MTEFTNRIAVSWHQVLDRVLADSRTHGAKGIVAFDLDSTLFDNRPRQARIVREFGKARGLAVLEGCQPFHFSSGWDLKAAMTGSGMSEADAETHYKDLKNFWGARFFTSDYCRDDIEIVGAPRYVQAVAATGVQVIYVTGRHEEMRAGSVECLAKCGIPVPQGNVKLLMKPTLRESDDVYKRAAHELLHTLGTLVAAFDNEPTHVNDYATKFPSSIPVHLATDHSGRPVIINERVISIPHFAY